MNLKLRYSTIIIDWSLKNPKIHELPGVLPPDPLPQVHFWIDFKIFLHHNIQNCLYFDWLFAHYVYDAFSINWYSFRKKNRSFPFVQFSRLHAEHKLVQNTIGTFLFLFYLFVCIFVFCFVCLFLFLFLLCLFVFL